MKHWFLRTIIYRESVDQYEIRRKDAILNNPRYSEPFKRIYRSLVETPHLWVRCQHWVTFTENTNIRFWICNGRSFFHLDLKNINDYDSITIAFTKKEYSILWQQLQNHKKYFTLRSLVDLMSALDTKEK